MTNFNNVTKEGKLRYIAKVCNDSIIPTVLCPWGCTEHLHQNKSVPYDVVVLRYLQKVDKMKIINKETFANLGYCRKAILYFLIPFKEEEKE